MIIVGKGLVCRRLVLIPFARTGVRHKFGEIAKTPVQKIGWTYLQRQEMTGRPLSPHLTIYKPQLTWVLSGLHRITGTIMSGTLVFAVIGFTIVPLLLRFTFPVYTHYDFTDFIEAIRAIHLPWPVVDSFKFLIALMITFHSLNGIRHLGFEISKGIELPQVYRSGWIVVAASVLISLAVVINARIKYGGVHPDTANRSNKVHHHETKTH